MTSRVLLGLLLSMTLWGSTFPVTKIALQVYDPFWITFVRLAIGSVIFLSLRKQWGRIRYQSGDWKWLLMLALFEPCGYFLLENQALRWTSASEASMIVALSPIMVTVGAWMFFRERISFRKGIGMLVAVAGVIILSTYSQASETSPRPLLGNLLESLAMLSGTGYALAVKHLGRRYPTFFLTAIQVFIGTFFFLPFLFMPFVATPTIIHKGALMGVVYLGLFCSGLPYFLYSFSFSKLPAYQVAISVNLIPVFGLFFGWLLLGEQLTFIQYIAVLIVFAGLALGIDLPKKKLKTSPQYSAQAAG